MTLQIGKEGLDGGLSYPDCDLDNFSHVQLDIGGLSRLKRSSSARVGFPLLADDLICEVEICIYERMTLAFWRHEVARKTSPSEREQVLQKRVGR